MRRGAFPTPLSFSSVAGEKKAALKRRTPKESPFPESLASTHLTKTRAMGIILPGRPPGVGGRHHSPSLQESDAMTTATSPKPRTVKPPKVKDQPLFIGGKWLDSVSGKTFATINPATGETICQVAEGDKADIDLAVKAARKAFEDGPWPRMNAAERGRLLYRLADLIEQHQRGTGGARVARQRQALPRRPQRRPAAHHQVLSLLRRLGRQDPRQDHPRRGQLTSATPGTNRWASSARSSRGTSRC